MLPAATAASGEWENDTVRLASSQIAAIRGKGMSIIIAFVSQKGGVGKSTLARALAREAGVGDSNAKSLISTRNREHASIGTTSVLAPALNP